jgi:hypothetical protein
MLVGDPNAAKLIVWGSEEFPDRGKFVGTGLDGEDWEIGEGEIPLLDSWVCPFGSPPNQRQCGGKSRPSLVGVCCEMRRWRVK